MVIVPSPVVRLLDSHVDVCPTALGYGVPPCNINNLS